MNIDEYNSMVEKIRTKKEWFDPFMRLCAGYYATNPCGGSLHIVLDDGNLENTHIDWCAGYAYGTGDMVGSRIASLMREMTMSQRRKVYANYGRYSGGTNE